MHLSYHAHGTPSVQTRVSTFLKSFGCADRNINIRCDFEGNTSLEPREPPQLCLAKAVTHHHHHQMKTKFSFNQLSKFDIPPTRWQPLTSCLPLGCIEHRSPALLRNEYFSACHRPARSVRPNPGVSCATANAPSAPESCAMTGAHEVDEAPKPWFM